LELFEDDKDGFDCKWVEWYFMCYNTVNYSIIVNSNPIDFISLKWSLRQGDPLSPLYLICVHNQPLTNQHNVEEIYMVQRFVEEHIVFHICILHMMIWYPFLSGIRVGSWIFTIALLMKQIQVGQFFFFTKTNLIHIITLNESIQGGQISKT